MLYSISDAPNNEVSFIALCEFWRNLLISNGMSSREASSLYQRVRLFDALSRARQHRDSAFDWLQILEERIGLDYLLEDYQRLRPDDLEEYGKLQDTLGPAGELEGSSLADMKDRIQGKDSVFVGTMHSSKGQENDVVIIAEAERLNTWDPERQNENQAPQRDLPEGGEIPGR